MPAKGTTATPPVERICRTCGTPFVVPGSVARDGHGIYCSRSCRAKDAPRRSLAERFWNKVERRGPDDCWLWQGGVGGGGYGCISVGGRGGNLLKAHRVSYELAHGPLADGIWVLHHCDNPPCVNPKHLFAGTPSDNMYDCSAKGRLHRRTKLTLESVRDIRRVHAAGEATYDQLAERYSVKPRTIVAVCKGENWKAVE